MFPVYTLSPSGRGNAHTGLASLHAGIRFTPSGGQGRGERQDYRPVEDLLDRLGDIEKCEQAGQNGQDERADDRAAAAPPAEYRRAADDHARNRRQKKSVGKTEVGGVGAADEHEAGDRREDRA
jgi:hypothetical protein